MLQGVQQDNACCRLYKSLGDYDVLQGIFSAKVGSQKITLEAMEAEMRGDYKTALTLYNQVGPSLLLVTIVTFW